MRLSVVAAFVAVGVSTGDAWACAVCYGDPNSPMVQGMKMGIIVLLGCISTVLIGFASMFVYWIYRSHRLAGPDFGEGATN